jgi:hypothetical protein
MSTKKPAKTAFSLEGIGYIALAPSNEPQKAYTLLKAQDAFFAFSDFFQEIRDKIKYGHDFKDANEALEWTRTTMLRILEDRNIDVDSGL